MDEKGKMNIFLDQNGSGITDDTQRFADALAQINAAGGGTIGLRGGTYLIKSAGNGLTVPSNCNIVGLGGETTIVLNTDVPYDPDNPAYGGVFVIQGAHDVKLKGFTIRRMGAILSNLILLDNAHSVTFEDLELDGMTALYSGPALCHGIRYGNNGGQASAVIDVEVNNCKFTGLAFSLYMTNNSTSSIDNFSVSNSLFCENYADDCNFNAPNGAITNVRVTNNHFADGLSKSNSGGFAVDFANVQHGSIANNTFSNYPYNAVHLEDRTAHVTVTGNVFKDCATTDESVVQIISGTRFVTISGNSFNQEGIEPTGARQSKAAIYIGPGGGTVTPECITINANMFSLGKSWDGVSAFSVPHVAIGNNFFKGLDDPATATNIAIDITNGGPVTINGNHCYGMHTFMPSTTTNFRTPSGSVVGNTIEHCNYGMKLQPTGSCIVMGNYFANCEYSLFSGSNGVTTALSAVIALNYAVNCVHSMGVEQSDFWGGDADTQRYVKNNCDSSMGTQGFPIS
jgi:hypothetical protein